MDIKIEQDKFGYTISVNDEVLAECLCIEDIMKLTVKEVVFAYAESMAVGDNPERGVKE